MSSAHGSFKVKMTPVESTELEKDAGLARMTIDKTWQGELSGNSTGSMLSSQIDSTGAMVYVALEKLSGELAGKKGSFYFSHSGWMKKGDPLSSILKVDVVQDSGTGGLTGITGNLTINIDSVGNHTYQFEYFL